MQFTNFLGQSNTPTNPAPTPQASSNTETSLVGKVANPNVPTQYWNGQQIPANINTQRLVSYDSKTGNKTFKLTTPTGQGQGRTDNGVYTEDAQGNIVNTGHSSYGGESATSGQERDDIIPVSLGGDNSNPGNIKMVPNSTAKPQDKAEADIARQVKSGQITSKDAITQILRQKSALAGAPSEAWQNHFLSSILPAVGETGKDIVKPVARLGVNAYDYGSGVNDLVRGRGAEKAFSELKSRNLPVLGKIGYSDPDTVKGASQIALDAIGSYGLGEAALNPIKTAEGTADAFKSVYSGMKSAVKGAAEETFAPATSAVEEAIPKSEVPNTPEMKSAQLKLQAAQKAHLDATNNLNEADRNLADLHQRAQAETPKVSDKTLQARVKDATPDYEPKMVKENIKNTEGKIVNRVNEAKTFGNRTVNSSASEIDNAKELANIKNYPEKGTALQKSQAVKAEISKEAESMRASLQAEDKATPLVKEGKQIVGNNVSKIVNQYITDEPNNSSLGRYLQRISDETNAYNGSREGILDMKQHLDDIYKEARGKQAFGSEKRNALDEANKEVRDYLTKELSESSTNTAVKDSLSKQTKLYRANDVLGDKAEAEGSTFGGRHPTMKKAGSRVALGALALAPLAALSPVRTVIGKVVKDVTGIGKTQPKPKAAPKPKARQIVSPKK